MDLASFKRNYLWPTLAGAVAAVSQALISVLSGVDPISTRSLGAAVLAALVAYGAGLMDRHGGSASPWVQPKKES